MNWKYCSKNEKYNLLCNAVNGNRIFLWNFVINKVCLLLIAFSYYPLSYLKQSYFQRNNGLRLLEIATNRKTVS